MGAVVSKLVLKYRLKRRSYNDPDLEGYYGLAPDVTVFDPPDLTVISGIIDQYGNPIKYELAGMDPIGFIHFNDDEDSESEEDA
jgi:hypothetical protein